MSAPLPSRLHRAAYRAQQTSMLLQCLAAHRVLRAVTRMKDDSPPGVLHSLRKRYQALLERDLENVDAGYYPQSLLFQFPFAGYARQLPAFVRDIPRVMRRMNRRDYRDLPGRVDLRRYPPYYRRNFHWQTDGYFSERSAELYDVGVELLFLGTADVMRRQIIPPIHRWLAERGGKDVRLLDVACGTGRTLQQIAVAQPALWLYGLDLSPYYLRVARDVLQQVPQVSLVAENAESMPFRDGHFDLLTSVHLFHELPRNARRNVVAEMHRVLRPGGMVVIEDSAQYSESSAIAPVLERFAREFHEPFHGDYIRDDLEGLLSEQGFRVDAVQSHFVSKVVVAHRPE